MKGFVLLQPLKFIIGAILFQNAAGAAFVHHSNRPPIGATYEKAIGLPVLGEQIFSLHIFSDNTAHLLVKGMLFLDEVVAYTVNARGCLNCSLSEHALSRLRRVRASLQEVGYDGETDTPYVKVSTPLPLPVKINLKRKACEEQPEITNDISGSGDCEEEAPFR
jgi:hypothetical protein